MPGFTGSRRAEFSAPARVNLIGEHTDYTGGLVMPMAIPFTIAGIELVRIDAATRLHQLRRELIWSDAAYKLP